MASLKLNGVGKVYPSGETALYDVNLETRDGEFIVVVGGEKCGKTSLLKVIAGLEEANAGTVEIDGNDVTEADPKDRNIAMVFRQDTLYPTMTVFENMAYGLRMRRAPIPVIEQRVKAAANILGLNDVLFKKPKTISPADRQKVALGRAIAREPRLYLFDEALSGLDENLRREMLNVIINLQARMKGTFIYATKSLPEALTIGTRMVILKEGFVQQIDTPANLYDYPANTFVAFYLGSPTINFIKDAQVEKRGDGYVFLCGGFELPVAENVRSRFDKIDDYAQNGGKLILGIRPEDIKAAAEGLPATLGKTESSGGVVYGECAVGTQNLLATVGEAAAGSLNLAVDLSRIYVFDGLTRLTLLSRDGGYKNTGFADADRVPMPYADELAVKEKLTPKKAHRTKK